MGDSDGRIRLIYVLSAGTAASICVDAQIFRIDVHMDLIVQLRRHFQHGERRLPLSCRIERRDPHQAVYPFLIFQIAVGILSFCQECGALDAGFRIVLQIQHLYRISLFITPAGIHPQQHFRPVHGVHTTGSRVNGNDSIAVIVFPRQQRPQPHLLQMFLESGEELLNFCGHDRQFLLVGTALFFHFCQLDQLTHIVQVLLQAFILGQGIFHILLFAHDLLRIF